MIKRSESNQDNGKGCFRDCWTAKSVLLEWSIKYLNEGELLTSKVRCEEISV